MKYLILIILSITVAGCVRAQDANKWNAVLKIVDDSEQPVANAKVSIFYDVPPALRGKDPGKVVGLTDTNGIFTASHNAKTYRLRFLIEKSGYYSDNIFHDFHGVFSTENLNPDLKLVLRKIGNPIPMYAKHEETKIQQEDKPMGFDLKVGDWVTPYGKGFHADLFFTAHRNIINANQYDCTLTVSFPNAGDGIMVAPSEAVTGSTFRTSRTAAESGYQSELTLHYSNTNSPEPVFGYFIRVRTELNQDGTIRSALYGKIPGGFKFYAGTRVPRAGMEFNYYLDPTPNDRNLEFDTKKNLIKDLGEFEGINKP